MNAVPCAPIVIQQPAAQSKLIEVLRIFAWPLFTLIVILLFWSPLHKLIGTVPDVLANSDTVTVGSLSLRVGKNLSDQSNQDVREALSGMTAEDVKTVIENEVGSEPTYYQGGTFAQYADQWDRLGRLGVVHVFTQAELRAVQIKEREKDPIVYAVTATPKYDKLRKFLYGVLNDVVAGGVREADSHDGPR